MLREDLLKHCCIHPPITPTLFPFCVWLCDWLRMVMLPKAVRTSSMSCRVASALLWPCCSRPTGHPVTVMLLWSVLASTSPSVTYAVFTRYTLHTRLTHTTHFHLGLRREVSIKSVMCVCAICMSSYPNNQARAESESCQYVWA